FHSPFPIIHDHLNNPSPLGINSKSHTSTSSIPFPNLPYQKLLPLLLNPTPDPHSVNPSLQIRQSLRRTLHPIQTIQKSPTFPPFPLLVPPITPCIPSPSRTIYRPCRM